VAHIDCREEVEHEVDDEAHVDDSLKDPHAARAVVLYVEGEAQRRDDDRIDEDDNRVRVPPELSRRVGADDVAGQR